MLLLAIDTSSAAVTVALHDGTSVVGEATRTGARAHGELLAPTIQQALTEAGAGPRDLTLVVVGIGPGPFTGLRVGIVTGRVMAAASGIEVRGACSLDALAWLAHHQGMVTTPFAVVTDARRREVYLATYDAAAVRQRGPDVVRPSDVADTVGVGPVVGEGAALYPEAFLDAREPRLVTGAAVASYAAEVLRAGQQLPDPDPMYLRRPDAVPPGAPKPVLR